MAEKCINTRSCCRVNEKGINQNRLVNFVIRVYEEISKQSQEFAWVDILTDTYPNRINLKEMTQHCRGTGMHVEFDNNIPFPADFANDFHRRFLIYNSSFINSMHTADFWFSWNLGRVFLWNQFYVRFLLKTDVLVHNVHQWQVNLVYIWISKLSKVWIIKKMSNFLCPLIKFIHDHKKTYE